MLKSPALFIGLRYLLAKKNTRLISFTALISMAGLTLGVMVVVLVMSIFNGTQGVMRDRTLITVPHGDIFTKGPFTQWRSAVESLQSIDRVEGVSPYIESEAMLSQLGYHQVAQIKGVIPESENSVSTLEKSMLLGHLNDLQAGQQGIILGRSLAGNLRLNVGDSVNLIAPAISDNSTSLRLKIHRFNVVGVFGVQFSADTNLAYIHIEDSLELLGIDTIEEAVHLRMKVTDVDEASSVIEEGLSLLKNLFPNQAFTGVDWSITESSLFGALKMEKLLIWFMLMMIVAIGAFNIISTLVMVVSDKQADIAILRTIGASEKTIMAIFMVQGLMVGIGGTLIGAGLGIVLTQYFTSITYFFEKTLMPDNLYMISSLPSQLQLQDVVLTSFCALIISFLATLYPAWKASRILPAEVLRYE